MNKLSSIKKVVFRSLGEFFANSDIAAMCQSNPLTAGIATYFGGIYSQEQFETIATFMHLLHARLQMVERVKIDIDFFNTREGKRIMGKIFRGILRDNRAEKLGAMANLTVSLYKKSILNVDEKELYVDILDVLNSLQLSILERAVKDIRTRNPKHRGLGWEILARDYGALGISKPLVLQSIRSLESNGIINQNTGSISGQDQTHFVTDFGEQFYDYISGKLNTPDMWSE